MNFWVEIHVDRRLRELGVPDDQDCDIVVTVPEELAAAALVDELQRPPWWRDLDAEKKLAREELPA